MAWTLGPDASQSDAAQVAQRAYEAFARRDLTALGTLLGEEVAFSWRASGGVTNGTGREALLVALARLVNATRGTAVADLRQAYADAEGRVVCLHRESARLAGRLHERESCLALTLARGRIVAVVQLDQQPSPAGASWRPDVSEDP